jgi:ubiquinone/menaquinone biosynthesis C-methylase UbiE
MQSASTCKPFKGSGMEGRTARWYARTRKNEIEDFRRQARNMAQHLRNGSRVLEVAPGPGYFAIELARLGNFEIIALDISKTFIEIANENAREAGVNIAFRQGNASAMPFADNSFDFIYCAAAFKNFAEPVKALDEMYRVLRPGGQAVIQDLRKDVSLDEINSYIQKSGRGWFDSWITKMVFKHMLIKRAYTKEAFLRMATQSRFASCQIQADSISLEVLFTKPAAA